MNRLDWEQLPPAVQDEVQQACGLVRKAESVTGAGGRPGFAGRVYADDDDVFVKAVPLRSRAAALYRRELQAAVILSKHHAPVPRLLWSSTVDEWLVLAFELVDDDARWVDLRPDSDDLPVVLETVVRLSTVGVRPVDRLVCRSATEHGNHLWARGRHLLDQAPGSLHARDLYEAALERFDPRTLNGGTLLHGNLAPRHMLIIKGRVYVTDWSEASIGPAWADIASLGPQLIAEGNASPEQADALLSSASPAYREVPARQLIQLAAIWSLAHLHQACTGPERDRERDLRLADAGRTWLAHLMSTSQLARTFPVTN